MSFKYDVKKRNHFLTHATGIQYNDPIKTSWRAPRCILSLPDQVHDIIRRNLRILVEGDDVPPACCSFRLMKLPESLVRALEAKGIKKPTPIQVQGIPAALSGKSRVLTTSLFLQIKI